MCISYVLLIDVAIFLCYRKLACVNIVNAKHQVISTTLRISDIKLKSCHNPAYLVEYTLHKALQLVTFFLKHEKRNISPKIDIKALPNIS